MQMPFLHVDMSLSNPDHRIQNTYSTHYVPTSCDERTHGQRSVLSHHSESPGQEVLAAALVAPLFRTNQFY